MINVIFSPYSVFQRSLKSLVHSIPPQLTEQCPVSSIGLNNYTPISNSRLSPEPPLYLLTPASLSKSFYYSDHITGPFASLEWTCNYPNNVLLVQSSVSVVECGLTGSGHRVQRHHKAVSNALFPPFLCVQENTLSLRIVIYWALY